MTDTTDIEALVTELHEGPRTGRAAWKKMDAAANALKRQQAVVEAARAGLVEAMITMSETPIPQATLALIESEGGSRSDAAHIGWANCFQTFEVKLKKILAALDAKPEGNGT